MNKQAIFGLAAFALLAAMPTVQAISLVPLPVGVPRASNVNPLNFISGSGPDYRCDTTAVAQTSNGDWGNCDTASGSGNAQAGWIMWCENTGGGCTQTDGTNHLYMLSCWSSISSIYGSCVEWSWFIEFNKGQAGISEASGSNANMVHIAVSIGQTVAQNELNVNPTGYYGGGLSR